MRKITILEKKTLSKAWATLYEYIYSYTHTNNLEQKLSREVYEKGDGSAIILYNQDKNTIILTKQFRIATYANGHKDGFMLEACAGLLDGQSPADCIVRETLEETGYRIEKPKRLFYAYMIPGAVTEIIHFFIAPYNEDSRMETGGGLKEEGEDIEVIELDFDAAYTMISTGEITDAKTIMLLQYMKINGIMRKQPI